MKPLFLETRRVTEQTKNLPEIQALYERAFPENERHPFPRLLLDQTGHIEIVSFWDKELFLGFAVLLTTLDISHIVYFAIEERLRNKGYGGLALQAVHRLKKGYRVIVDIERDLPQADNREQRQKRKQFYLRQGYRETEVKYRWRQEDYEILAYGGTLSDQDFSDFWENLQFSV